METFFLSGNNLTKNNQYELAILEYEKALEVSENLFDKLPISNEKLDILIRLYLNLGFCHGKLRNYHLSIEAYNSIIRKFEYERDDCMQLDKNTLKLVIKALLRRAIDFEKIEEYVRAKNDIDLIYELNPSTKFSEPNLQSQYNRLLKIIKKDSQIAAEEGKPNWISNAGQTLRLIQLSEVPLNASIDQFINMRIGIGNELGLFNRSLVLKDETDQNKKYLGKLKCEVIQAIDYSIPILIQLHESEDPSMNSSLDIPESGKVSLRIKFSKSLTHSLLVNNIITVVMLKFSVEEFISSQLLVLPILTLPIYLTTDSRPLSSIDFTNHPIRQYSELKSILDTAKEMEVNCIRPIDTFNNSYVLVFESPGFLGIAGKVWDSSYILTQYFNSNRGRPLITGKRVLELGSGTGVSGLTLSILKPKKVTMTDLGEAVHLMECNIKLNGLIEANLHSKDLLIESYTGCELAWGTSVDVLKENSKLKLFDSNSFQYDLIIASDIVYYPEGYEPLVNSIRDLLEMSLNNSLSASPQTSIHFYMAHRHRHPDDPKFFRLLSEIPYIIVNEIDWKPEISTENEITSMQDIRIFDIYIQL